MQFRGDGLNIDTANFNGESALPSVYSNDPGVVLDPEDSASESSDSDSSTESPRPPEPSSISPLMFWYPSGETDVHSSIAQSIPPFAANRCFIIAFLYILPPSLLGKLSSPSCLPSEGLA